MEIGLGSLGVKGIGQHIVTISLILFAFSYRDSMVILRKSRCCLSLWRKIYKTLRLSFRTVRFSWLNLGRQPRLAFC